MENKKTNLKDGDLLVRAAAESDIDLIIDLINAAAARDTGVADMSREDKLLEWGLAQFDMTTDTRLMLLSNGPATASQPG